MYTNSINNSINSGLSVPVTAKHEVTCMIPNIEEKTDCRYYTY